MSVRSWNVPFPFSLVHQRLLSQVMSEAQFRGLDNRVDAS